MSEKVRISLLAFMFIPESFLLLESRWIGRKYKAVNPIVFSLNAPSSSTRGENFPYHLNNSF